MPYGEKILSWHAPEYLKFKKTYKWYVVAGSIMLTIIIYGILAQDILLTIVFLVFSGVYFLISRENPQIVDYEMTNLGILSGKNFYPYSQIESFSIIHNVPHLKILKIFVKKKAVKETSVILGNVSAADIREILLNKKIEELTDVPESLLSILSRVLRL